MYSPLSFDFVVEPAKRNNSFHFLKFSYFFFSYKLIKWERELQVFLTKLLFCLNSSLKRIQSPIVAISSFDRSTSLLILLILTLFTFAFPKLLNWLDRHMFFFKFRLTLAIFRMARMIWSDRHYHHYEVCTSYKDACTAHNWLSACCNDY